MKKIIQPTQKLKKICVFALLTCNLLIFYQHASAYAIDEKLEQAQNQAQRATIIFKDKPIKVVLNEIKDQFKVGFALSADIEKSIGLVSINAKNKTLVEVMDILLSKTNYNYKIVNNQIILVKKGPKKPGKICLQGVVLDNSNTPLPGAIVHVKGLTKGAETDFDGNFYLELDKAAPIEVSYMGMQTFTKDIKEDNLNMTIKMLVDNQLDEIVVTGIFNKNKETFTGSVTSISDKELANFSGQNLISTLKNIDPVLNISINNSLGSNPNALPEISIRGNSSLPTSVKELNEGAKAQLNTPLIIMDGFEISLQKLMDYNDEDIESMNILKDASATAIYGSKGANGVIVISTKAPQPGKIKVYLKAGLNLEIPDLSSYNLMNAREKLDLETSIGAYRDLNDPLKDRKLQERYYSILKDIESGADSYWIKQPVRTGVGQKYNLNVTGGTQEFRWGINLAYNKILGAMKGSDRSNFNGTINLSYSYKNLIFKNQTIISSNVSNEGSYGKFSDYANMNPYWKIWDDEGALIPSYTASLNSAPIGNPLFNSTLNTFEVSKYTEIVNNFSIEWEIIKDLRLRGQFGLTKQFNSGDTYYPASHTKFLKYKDDEAKYKGEYNYSDGENFNYDANATLSYSKEFAKKHSIYLGADFSISERNAYNYMFTVVGFPNEDISFPARALTYKQGEAPQGSESRSRSVGFTLNANYTYDNRYFIDGSYRMDGSSQFGANNRFAPFWSIGLGWNIHREKFMQDQKLISNLKLRASIGESGSQQFSPYQALSMFEYYTGTRYGIWSGADLMGLGNPNLKWQKVFQSNIGLDISFWQGRLSASVDVYQKKTRDLLSLREVQLSTGFPSYMENIGEISNKGVEAMLSGYIIRNTEKKFTWSLTTKIAYNKNRIEKLSEAMKKNTQDALINNTDLENLMFEGDPTNAIYAVRSLGIDPSTGKEIFLDRDGNISPVWNAKDKVYMGTSDPLYRGNISTLLQYKGFSLNLAFGFYFGGYQYNQTLLNKVEITSGAMVKRNVDKRVLSERWQKPGDVTFFKGIGTDITKATSRFVMKDNTFDLQNVSLQYTFDGKLLKEKAKIQSIIVGCNMSDVFYVSTIKRERGTDYPFARRTTISLSLTF